MEFGKAGWDVILPTYLIDTEKGRLKNALAQFFNEHRSGEKKYDHFYLEKPPDYFLQGDILQPIKSLSWDDDTNDYTFENSPALLLSNTCDVSDNNRTLSKQALYAPIINLKAFITVLEQNGTEKSQITSIINNLKSQTYSNVFYLPPNPINGNEYIVYLDKIFWQPVTILKNKEAKIKDERFLSLGHFGFYLLITKLSYHFCRVPEEIDR